VEIRGVAALERVLLGLLFELPPVGLPAYFPKPFAQETGFFRGGLRFRLFRHRAPFRGFTWLKVYCYSPGSL